MMASISGSPLRLGVTRASQSPECPAPSGVLGDSSDLAGCAPLERLLPCPFRRPSMAGGRRPLAATSLHHKHGGRLDRRGLPETPCSGPTNRRVPTQRGGRAARQLCWSSIPGTGDEASLWCDGRWSQGRESPPNDEESRISPCLIGDPSSSSSVSSDVRYFLLRLAGLRFRLWAHRRQRVDPEAMHDHRWFVWV